MVDKFPWLSPEDRHRRAMQYARQGLRVWTRKKDPLGWADFQQNLAMDYLGLYNLHFRGARISSEPKSTSATRCWSGDEALGAPRFGESMKHSSYASRNGLRPEEAVKGT
jgi:hypothetical protein